MSKLIRIHYVSPSCIPSRTANSIHVVLQCEALSRAGAQVILYAKRSISDQTKMISAISAQYGVNLEGVSLKTFYSKFSRADAWRIALLALRDSLGSKPQDVVISRNLYAAFILGGLFRRSILFETHQLEIGIRKRMQRWVMTRPKVTTVVISKKLDEILTEYHGVMPSKAVVLHDAALSGIQPVAPEQRRERLQLMLGEDLSKWDTVCGYFGHLYSGRGIEIIEGMANLRPNSLFLVFGGNESQIKEKKAVNRRLNLRFMGFVPHSRAKETMFLMDVLLMPYQNSVSIGVAGHDTARWMSPMKMFEYMATGVPIISSDLPVLREVLKHEVNSLLVVASDCSQWAMALDRVVKNREFAVGLGNAAHTDYLTNHTWIKRAEALLKLAGHEK